MTLTEAVENLLASGVGQYVSPKYGRAACSSCGAETSDYHVVTPLHPLDAARESKEFHAETCVWRLLRDVLARHQEAA